MVEPERLQTHSEYAILIAFPLQKWLDECTSLLVLFSVSTNLLGEQFAKYPWPPALSVETSALVRGHF